MGVKARARAGFYRHGDACMRVCGVLSFLAYMYSSGRACWISQTSAVCYMWLCKQLQQTFLNLWYMINQSKANIYTQNSFLFFQRKNCPGWDSNPRHSAF